MHRTFSHTIAAELAEVRSAPDSNGTQVAAGPSLSTTLKALSVPLGADWVSVTPRNFVGCNVVRFALNPYLVILRTTDALTVASNFTDFSDESQDGDATDQNLTIGTAAQSDYLYVGAAVQFRGVAVDIGTTANTTASVLTVNFWEGGWSTTSATDDTASGGASLAVDGNVTWTVPSTWTKASLQVIGDIGASAAAFRDTFTPKSPFIAPLYWTRWQWGAAVDDPTHVRQLRALSRSTAYAELLEGQSYQQAIQSEGPGGIATVEALTDAGTANVIINAGAGRGETFD